MINILVILAKVVSNCIRSCAHVCVSMCINSSKLLHFKGIDFCVHNKSKRYFYVLYS